MGKVEFLWYGENEAVLKNSRHVLTNALQWVAAKELIFSAMVLFCFVFHYKKGG